VVFVLISQLLYSAMVQRQMKEERDSSLNKVQEAKLIRHLVAFFVQNNKTDRTDSIII
jgi:hypothetical protein